MTNKQQSKVDEWLAFDEELSMLCLYQPPPKRHNLPLGSGEGMAGFDLALKERAGDAIIMMWTMTMTTTMTVARGGSKGKVLMIVIQSISE